VVALLELEVVEVHPGRTVGRGAAEGHDPGLGRGPDQVDQLPGQGEVAEVIGAELHLEPVLGHPAGRDGHDPGVVDEQVDRPPVALAPGGELGDGGEAGQVQLLARDLGAGDGGLDAGHRGLALAGAAGRHDDVGPGARERLGHLEADTAVGAGDDGKAAGLVGHLPRAPGRERDRVHGGKVTEHCSSNKRTLFS
jgi:hypothetical protein